MKFWAFLLLLALCAPFSVARTCSVACLGGRQRAFWARALVACGWSIVCRQRTIKRHTSGFEQHNPNVDQSKDAFIVPKWKLNFAAPFACKRAHTYGHTGSLQFAVRSSQFAVCSSLPTQSICMRWLSIGLVWARRINIATRRLSMAGPLKSL